MAQMDHWEPLLQYSIPGELLELFYPPLTTNMDRGLQLEHVGVRIFPLIHCLIILGTSCEVIIVVIIDLSHTHVARLMVDQDPFSNRSYLEESMSLLVLDSWFSLLFVF
jgi:hypothetical protein